MLPDTSLPRVLSGFNRDVMNTGNTSITRETTTVYSPSWTPTIRPRCSARSTDPFAAIRQRTEHFGGKLTRFAEALLPLSAEDTDRATESLGPFAARFQTNAVCGA